MNTEKNAPARPRTKWGSSKYGGGPLALIVGSIAGGIPIAALLGWVVTLLEGERSLLLFIISGIVMLPVSTGAIWFLLLDRETLSGAPDDPASSIEGRWMERAMAGAFTDLMVVMGIGAAAFSFIDIPIDTAFAFMIVFGIAVADAFLRYFIIKRREG